MPVPNYSVLKGDPTGAGTISGSNPHYRFSLKVNDGSSVEVDVNVQSTDGSEIRYLIAQNFQPVDPDGLQALPMSRTELANTDSDLRLDYVLEKNPDGTPMVDPSKLQLLDIG